MSDDSLVVLEEEVEQEGTDLASLEGEILLEEGNDETSEVVDLTEEVVLDEDTDDSSNTEVILEDTPEEQVEEPPQGLKLENENPLKFEDNPVQKVPELIKPKDTDKEQPEQNVNTHPLGVSVFDIVKNSMIGKTLTDTDFTDICRLQKLEANSVLEGAKRSGIHRDVVLYGLVNKKMGIDYKKMKQGVYKPKGLSVIDELLSRLDKEEPALSEQEYKDYCTFLGVTQESIDKRAQTMWLCCEEVLKGVLKQRMDGE